MGEFDGKTCFHDDALDTFAYRLFVGRVRENRGKSEFCKKGLPEWHEFPHIQDLWDTDRFAVNRSVICGVEEFVPHFKKVRHVSFLTASYHVILLAPASIEKRAFVFDGHFSDFAEVLAPFTFECFDRIGPLAKIKTLKVTVVPALFFHGEQGHADSAGNVMVGRHCYRFADCLLEGSDNSFIESSATLKENLISYFSVTNYLV